MFCPLTIKHNPKRKRIRIVLIMMCDFDKGKAPSLKAGKN
jgi:hypothetical protein